jgi:hypothetical protein
MSRQNRKSMLINHPDSQRSRLKGNPKQRIRSRKLRNQ